MINFRYHVVSIVAVFLALAIGIVLGATELRGHALDELTRTSNSLAGDLSAARTQNAALKQQVDADQGFAQADEARLLDRLLTGQKVVLAAAPGASGSVLSGLTSALQQAGATVTGQIDLQPKLLDSSESNQQNLAALVTQLAPPGSTTANGTPLQQAAQLLGSAILTKDNPETGGGSDGESVSSRKAVLAGYGQAGLVTVASGNPATPATLAVLVPPASVPTGSSASSANQGLVTLAQELDGAGLGTVMAGTASGSVSGSAIDALRSSTVASEVSSVDDADTVVGQIVTVQALQQELAGHKAGNYGEDAGATAAAPSPAPSPSPTDSQQVTSLKKNADHTSKNSTKTEAGRATRAGTKSAKGKA